MPDQSLYAYGGGDYPPQWIYHYCANNVNWHWHWDFNNGGYRDCQATVTARTTVKLLTGGKAKVGRQNLFCIQPWATAYGKSSQGYWLGVPATDLPKDSLRVLGKQVGADGNLWVTLPDNSEQDITVAAPAKHYNAGESVQKYPTWITANESNLETNTPEFCVGQHVTFTLQGLPGNVTNVVGQWNLPAKFVNQQTNYSPTCLTYVQNNDLLQNVNQTSCWFVNVPGGQGHVSVGLNLKFDNGQTAGVAANGDFTVFRPKILGHEFVSSGTVELNTNDLSNIRLGMLYAGSDYIHWTTDVEMKEIYPGTLSFQQLVDWDASYDIGLYCMSQGRSTDGQYWLDNTAAASDIHSPNGTIFSASQGIPFRDGPEISSSFCTFAQLTPSFKTYLRFQPDGGIPITLERAEWTEYGRADSNGAIWSLTTHSVDGPHFYPDDAFPVWSQIFINHE